MLHYNTTRILIVHEQYSLKFEYQTNVLLVFPAQPNQLYSTGSENIMAMI